MIVLGLLLVGLAVVLVLLDWDGLSKRMPTQVPPRALAPLPFVLGVALVATGLVR